ncbi:hypothetical protein GCM10018790_55460 [Kitasatospora xanthocidica]|nr:hypothetical protein GCM10018790_55460 [Kitasatospora xanthocidica]
MSAVARSPSGSSVITPATSSPQSAGASAAYRSTTSARVGSFAFAGAAVGAGVGAGEGAALGVPVAVGAAAAPDMPDGVAAAESGDEPDDEAEPASDVDAASVRHPASTPPASTTSSARRLTATPASNPSALESTDYMTMNRPFVTPRNSPPPPLGPSSPTRPTPVGPESPRVHSPG